MQIIRSRTLYDVLSARLRRRRRDGRPRCSPSPAPTSSCSRPGRCGIRRASCTCTSGCTTRRAAARRCNPRAAVRRVRRRPRWLDARGRTVYERSRGQVGLVPVANDRRAHQPLGTDFAAVRSLRFSAEDAWTASVTTGRLPTTTSSRTTTKSITLIGIFGFDGEPPERARTAFLLPPPKPRCQLLIEARRPKSSIPFRSSHRVCRS